MTKLIITSILAGTFITINGMAIDAPKLISHATMVAGQANIRQFSTALDLYYIDHNRYPEVSGGEAMVAALEEGKYIRTNALLDPDQFDYQTVDDGRNYLLTFNQ